MKHIYFNHSDTTKKNFKIQLKKPLDLEPIAFLYPSSKEDIQYCIQNASDFNQSKFHMPLYTRIAILEKFKLAILEKLTELATEITLLTGKSMNESEEEIIFLTELIQYTLEFIAQEKSISFSIDRSDKINRHMPIFSKINKGIILGINDYTQQPLHSILYQLLPAIATNNPIILYQNPIAAAVCNLFIEILYSTEISKNFIQIICYTGYQLFSTCIQNKNLSYILALCNKKIKFMIYRENIHSFPCLINSYSPSVGIVEKDADVLFSIQSLVKQMFYYSGQDLKSINTIYIHQNILEYFIEELKIFLDTIPIGNSLQKDSLIGAIPIENIQQINQWITQIKQEHKMIYGGYHFSRTIYNPTVIYSQNPILNFPKMLGPLVNLIPFTDMQTIEQKEFLNISLFSQNINKSMHYFKQFNFNFMSINSHQILHNYYLANDSLKIEYLIPLLQKTKTLFIQSHHLS